MNRREFLECAAILVSGASVGNNCFALNDGQMTYLATAPDYNNKTANLFCKAQRRILTAMAEIVIPRTDTPGATDAGVPKFIELMAADWFNEQERGIFIAGLRDMQTLIPLEFGKPFEQLAHAEQLSILEDMEASASESPWYQRGNIRRSFISDAPFICMVKELTIWGFFTSRVGASQVLRYSAMPMRFDGNVPLSPDESSWAPYFFL